MAQTTSAFAALHGRQYINLTTYCKSGAAVTTPVWFALSGDTIYVLTVEGRGKVKRLRSNGRVQIAPCTFRGRALGPTVDGVARIMAPGEADVARRVLDKKYGLKKRLFAMMIKLQRRETVYLDIVPAGSSRVCAATGPSDPSTTRTAS